MAGAEGSAGGQVLTGVVMQRGDDLLGMMHGLHQGASVLRRNGAATVITVAHRPLVQEIARSIRVGGERRDMGISGLRFG
jgi:hypothetical protein